MEKGCYLNDYKEGASYWEVDKRIPPDSFVLVLKSKPLEGKNDQLFYRKRLFFNKDIGKKLFVTKEEAQRSLEKI